MKLENKIAIFDQETKIINRNNLRHSLQIKIIILILWRGV